MFVKQALVIWLVALSPFAIDHEQFEGTWVGASRDKPEDNHVFLSIDDDASGRFAFVAQGRAILDFRFDADDVAMPEGYVEVTQRFDGDWGAKVLVSGWTSAEDQGVGLLTGYVFMYQLQDGEGKVFNSFPLEMWAYGGPVVSGGSDLASIDKIVEHYESPDVAD